MQPTDLHDPFPFVNTLLMLSVHDQQGLFDIHNHAVTVLWSSLPVESSSTQNSNPWKLQVTNFGLLNVRYQGVKTWNSLNESYKNLSTSHISKLTFLRTVVKHWEWIYPVNIFDLDDWKKKTDWLSEFFLTPKVIPESQLQAEKKVVIEI